MNDQVPDRRRFRLSFVLCLIFFVAVAFAGVKFDEAALKRDPTSWVSYLYGEGLILSGPITTACVLLLGRNTVAIPIATGLLCAVAIGIGGRLVNLGSAVSLTLPYLLGSMFGLVSMLAREITPIRILLGAWISFFLGPWVLEIVRRLFERIGGP